MTRIDGNHVPRQEPVGQRAGVHDRFGATDLGKAGSQAVVVVPLSEVLRESLGKEL